MTTGPLLPHADDWEYIRFSTLFFKVFPDLTNRFTNTFTCFCIEFINFINRKINRSFDCFPPLSFVLLLYLTDHYHLEYPAALHLKHIKPLVLYHFNNAVCDHGERYYVNYSVLYQQEQDHFS